MERTIEMSKGFKSLEQQSLIRGKYGVLGSMSEPLRWYRCTVRVRFVIPGQISYPL